MPSSPVIVLGMHRSGTSAIAGVLHASGYHMGDDATFRPKPAPENPRGYYENFRFRSLNDRILEQSGYTVKEMNPRLPPLVVRNQDHKDIRSLIQEYSQHEKWGWKDPRTCLTFGIWAEELRNLKLLDGTRVVFIYRDPEEVWDSFARNRKLPKTRDDALQLWVTYNMCCLLHLEYWKVNKSIIRHDQIVKDVGILQEKLEKIGVTITNRAIEHFDSSLVNTNWMCSRPNLTGYAKTLLEKLDNLS